MTKVILNYQYLQLKHNSRMRFVSKADILGRMGKSRSDVRLIDRMIGRGQIKKVGDIYEVDENFFIKGVNEYDKNMTLPDKDGYISIRKDEYINLIRLKNGVKLLDSGYKGIIDKLIQYKKAEEKEQVREEIKEMKAGVAREIDK